MKQLNFTAKEILPSLLNKSKTQTIRKAWNDIPMDIIVSDKTDGMSFMTKDQLEKFSVNDIISKQTHIWQVSKPTAYKVGDIVPVVWGGNNNDLFNACLDFDDLNIEGHNLGKVKITEVFKIEMGKAEIPYFLKFDITKKNENKYTFKSYIKDLVTQDGFKSFEEMMFWFDENYNLNRLREFWVYRWEWIK